MVERHARGYCKVGNKIKFRDIVKFVCFVRLDFVCLCSWVWLWNLGFWFC